MNFQHIQKLAEYNGKLPKLISEISASDTTVALQLLSDWANAKRPLREIYDDALANLNEGEKAV